MPWDETDAYIRSGHRSPDAFTQGSLRTVYISREEGIKAVMGKLKGGDAMTVQSYLFDKEKGWTMAKAKAWFREHERQRIKFESRLTSPVTEAKGRRIKGILAYPGISCNNNLYFPEELAAGHGKTLPVYWNHQYQLSEDGGLIGAVPLGTARLTWNPELRHLEYEAEIYPEHEHYLNDAKYVSLGAEYEYEERLNGYMVPRGLSFYEMSLTPEPSLTRTSVQLLEHGGVRRIIEHVEVTQSTPPQGGVGVAPQNPNAEERGSEMSSDAQASSPHEGEKSMSQDHRQQDKEHQTLSTAYAPTPALQSMPQDTATQRPASPEVDPRNFGAVHVDALIKAMTEGIQVTTKAVLEEVRKDQEVFLKALYEQFFPGEGEKKAKVSTDRDAIGATPPLLGEEETLVREITEKMERFRRKEANYVAWKIPRIDVPSDPGKMREFQGKVRERRERITETLHKIVRETMATGGAGEGKVWTPPTVVLPPDLPALLRNTVVVADIPEGAKDFEWTTLSSPAFGALTENTEPTEATHTRTAKTVTPTPRGWQQSVSFELEEVYANRDLMVALTETARLGAVVDEDSLILTALDAATPAATLYGDESVSSDAAITSTMTFSHKRVSSAIEEVQKTGYSPDNYVLVLHPIQYDALRKETDIYRDIEGFSVDVLRRGVVPSLYGAEVRPSTKVTTGTGSAAATVYDAQFYKKGVSAGLAIGRDLLVETFRDIRKNQTVVKVSTKMKAIDLQPNSIVAIHTQ